MARSQTGSSYELNKHAFVLQCVSACRLQELLGILRDELLLGHL